MCSAVFQCTKNSWKVSSILVSRKISLFRQKIRIMSNALLYLLNDMYHHPETEFYRDVKIERAAIGVIEITRCFGTDKDNDVGFFSSFTLRFRHHSIRNTWKPSLRCYIASAPISDSPRSTVELLPRWTLMCRTISSGTTFVEHRIVLRLVPIIFCLQLLSETARGERK